MLAGPICEGDSCDALVFFIFLATAVIALMALTFVVCTWYSVSRRLIRSGTPRWKANLWGACAGLVPPVVIGQLAMFFEPAIGLALLGPPVAAGFAIATFMSERRLRRTRHEEAEASS
jgi:hypothetical protein